MYPQLDQYQKEAYQAMLKISHQHRGGFLCDGVGLGKTFVGLLLIERLIHDRKKVFLIVPKSGREAVWQRSLRKYLPHLFGGFSDLRIFNHTDLMRGGGFPEELQRMKEQADVILIDEAHHFRNRGLATVDGEIRSRYWKLYGSGSKQDGVSAYSDSGQQSSHGLPAPNRTVFARQPKSFATTLGIHALPAYFQKLEKQLSRLSLAASLGELFDRMEWSRIRCCSKISCSGS